MTTADLTDRAKLLAFLKSGSEERQAKRPRVAESASFGSDGLLDGPPGVVLHGCRSLSDRNSILLSKTKVGAVPLCLRAASQAPCVAELCPRPRDAAVRLERAVVASARLEAIHGHCPRCQVEQARTDSSERSHPPPA